MPKLHLHSPAFIPGLGSTLVIPGDDVTVGRSPDNDIVIPESTVSARHARIQRTPEGWLLTDLGDTNGIWIGVRRVTEHLLTPGQLFRIGGVALEFVPDGRESALVIEARSEPTATDRDNEVGGDSGIRPTGSGVRSGPTDVNPPDWQVPSEPVPQQQQRTPSASQASKKARGGFGRVLAVLLALIVLGFAVTLGAVGALRWLTNVHKGPRTVPSFAPSSASPSSAAGDLPKLPEVTLADKSVESLNEEQRIEVAGVMNLQLPANALHKATHLVVARAPNSGTLFCGATQFANTAYEIATAYNAVWAHAATVELPVDVDQLAKTQVPALAIGLRDSADEQWTLLPTEYDATRRIARAKLWQPGMIALFLVKGHDSYAGSDHFALLFEPRPGADSTPSGAPEKPQRALNQLESALGEYRKLGYRIPDGTLWVCAARGNPARPTALMPVFSRRELDRQHSPASARAAFAAIVPAYLNAHSMTGREFWFASMFDAIAAQASGIRATTAQPTFKRLANPLIADDWPGSPLLLNLIPKMLDKQVDLFRLWNDTAHMMSDLDNKPGSEGQSPVLAVDMSLQEITKKSLLDHYSSYVTDRLLAEHGLSLEALRSHEVCTNVTQLAVEARNAAVTLDIPTSFTARWACIVVDVKPGSARSVHLGLASDVPANLSLQLLRLGTGQVVQSAITAAHATRFDLNANEVFILSAVNPSMNQSSSIGVKVDDVTIATSLVPSDPASVRTGQSVSSTLNLSGIAEELKTLIVQWDFGDGSAKTSSEWTPNANRALRIDQAHSWTNEGTYILRASVFDPAQPTQELSFASRSIIVQQLKMEIVVVSANPQAQADVRLHAKLSGPLPDAPAFRFSFGDGSSPASSASPDVTHQFGSAGDFTVTAEALAAAGSNEILATAKTIVSVRSAEAPANSGNSTPQPVATVAPGAPPQ